MVMFLSWQDRFTGGTVVPCGNPPYVLGWDYHVVKKHIITSSLRDGKPWLIKPGQGTLFSLGRWIVYKKETCTRKPTPKSDAKSQWRKMEEQHGSITWMDNSRSHRDGVLPPDSLQATEFQALCLKSPPQATGGHPAPMRAARLRRRRVNATGKKNSDPEKQNKTQDHSTF